MQPDPRRVAELWIRRPGRRSSGGRNEPGHVEEQVGGLVGVDADGAAGAEFDGGTIGDGLSGGEVQRGRFGPIAPGRWIVDLSTIHGAGTSETPIVIED